MSRAKIIFITGTDTGVGKTVLTALLLRHLRQSGCHALAMKPFCSGFRADALLLRDMQDGLLTLEEINPFFVPLPMAPAAVGGRSKVIRLDTVLGKIRAMARRGDILLVEGIGGLLVPLGQNYTVADLIRRLGCAVLVVSRNRLGTINHTLLTINSIQNVGIKQLAIVMMGEKKPDISAKTNPKIIQKMASKTPIFLIPNLGLGASKEAVIKKNAIFLKKTLARILNDGSFIPLPRRGRKDCNGNR